MISVAILSQGLFAANCSASHFSNSGIVDLAVVLVGRAEGDHVSPVSGPVLGVLGLVQQVVDQQGPLVRAARACDELADRAGVGQPAEHVEVEPADEFLVGGGPASGSVLVAASPLAIRASRSAGWSVGRPRRVRGGLGLPGPAVDVLVVLGPDDLRGLAGRPSRRRPWPSPRPRRSRPPTIESMTARVAADGSRAQPATSPSTSIRHGRDRPSASMTPDPALSDLDTIQHRTMQRGFEFRPGPARFDELIAFLSHA